MRSYFRRADPFFDEQENHSLIGVANVFLSCLFYDVKLQYAVPIINQKGEVGSYTVLAETYMFHVPFINKEGLIVISIQNYLISYHNFIYSEFDKCFILVWFLKPRYLHWNCWDLFLVISMTLRSRRLHLWIKHQTEKIMTASEVTYYTTCILMYDIKL